MSQFLLNGEKKPLTSGSITELMIAEGLVEETGIAVALNNGVVPKRDWSNTRLKPDDVVEIVKPFSGG